MDGDARDEFSSNLTIIKKQHFEEIHFHLTFSTRSCRQQWPVEHLALHAQGEVAEPELLLPIQGLSMISMSLLLFLSRSQGIPCVHVCMHACVHVCMCVC